MYIYIYNIDVTVQIRHECCTRWMQFVLIVIVCYEGAWEFMFSVFWTFLPDSAWLSLSSFLWKGDIHWGEKEIKEIYAYIAYPNKRKDVLHMFSHYELSILTFLILVSRGGSFP